MLPKPLRQGYGARGELIETGALKQKGTKKQRGRSYLLPKHFAPFASFCEISFGGQVLLRRAAMAEVIANQHQRTSYTWIA